MLHARLATSGPQARAHARAEKAWRAALLSLKFNILYRNDFKQLQERYGARRGNISVVSDGLPPYFEMHGSTSITSERLTPAKRNAKMRHVPRKALSPNVGGRAF